MYRLHDSDGTLTLLSVHRAKLPDGSTVLLPSGTVLEGEDPNDKAAELRRKIESARRECADAGDRHDGYGADQAGKKLRRLERELAKLEREQGK